MTGIILLHHVLVKIFSTVLPCVGFPVCVESNSFLPLSLPSHVASTLHHQSPSFHFRDYKGITLEHRLRVPPSSITALSHTHIELKGFFNALLYFLVWMSCILPPLGPLVHYLEFFLASLSTVACPS